MDGRALAAIREHGARAYPEECCGALLGVVEDGTVRVARVERIENARREERRRRYAIEPLEYARLEKRADSEGLSILGFYHSHPDHPAVPSEYDREHGLPFFHYVLVAVAAGVAGEVASFVLSEDRGVFDREELLVDDPGE
ncbi:MAG TPA: Mov34/MPN/PAD-1 family protein [Thermoanaerobaculia bacterium]|nr:Mov34/MPN/PAD-1 family protein [Thermoanaerobaculia bacterium]